MTDLSKWIAEAEERCEKATEGPWYSRIIENEGDVWNGAGPIIPFGEKQAPLDAAFISSSRTDLPRALHLLKAAVRVVECAREYCDAMNGGLPQEEFDTSDGLGAQYGIEYRDALHAFDEEAGK